MVSSSVATGGQPPARSRTAVITLAWLSSDAFEGDPAHSLVANLRDLRDADWTATPPGGARSIAEIVEHIAWAKWMYQDYAFGSASLRGDQPPLVPHDGSRARPRDELLAWLMEGHSRWLAAINGLRNDAELDQERLTNWGEYLPLRTLIRIMIAHDLYHAGEINHIRAILHNRDRWAYDES